MARLKDRCNLFTGKFRVAPRPFVPAHWDVPEDYPSADRFWVDTETGATAPRCGGEGWTHSEALQQWHLRQAARLWAGRRLLSRHGREAAERRAKDLQVELVNNFQSGNAYLDLLVSIGYEACRLTRRAERAEKMLVETTRSVLQIASFLGNRAGSFDVVGAEAVASAQAAARALDQLAETLKQSVSPVDRRFEPPLLAAVDDGDGGRDVCEWVRYTTPSRNYRKPDLQWLVASAVVTFRENVPELSTDVACKRVGGYLALLDAPIGSLDARSERGHNPPTIQPQPSGGLGARS